MYDTFVYVEFSEESNITDIAQIIRSLPYVTVVNNKTDKDDLEPRGILEVKVVTTKPGQETFDLVKKLALRRYLNLKSSNTVLKDYKR
jgi:hypothetical protein